jgi:hypothetical protein
VWETKHELKENFFIRKKQIIDHFAVIIKFKTICVQTIGVVVGVNQAKQKSG